MNPKRIFRNSRGIKFVSTDSRAQICHLSHVDSTTKILQCTIRRVKLFVEISNMPLVILPLVGFFGLTHDVDVVGVKLVQVVLCPVQMLFHHPL